MTGTQRRTVQAIVNIFETGSVTEGYGVVTRAAGDAGHLSYGRAQASLASGSLFRLVDAYCREEGARCANLLVPYLDRLRRCDVALDGDERLCSALREAAGDPAMRDAQDRHFESAYFEPARAAAERAGLRSPLAVAVVYDSFVQGGWTTVSKRVTGQGGEAQWLADYIAARREWLKSLGGLAARTTYRIDELEHLLRAGNFELNLPIEVRGVRIDAAALGIDTLVAAKEKAGQLGSRPAA